MDFCGQGIDETILCQYTRSSLLHRVETYVSVKLMSSTGRASKSDGSSAVSNSPLLSLPFLVRSDMLAGEPDSDG